MCFYIIHCVKDKTVTKIIIQPTLHSTAAIYVVQYDVIYNLHTEKKLIYGNVLCHKKFNFIITPVSSYFFYPDLKFTPETFVLSEQKVDEHTAF